MFREVMNIQRSVFVGILIFGAVGLFALGLLGAGGCSESREASENTAKVLQLEKELDGKFNQPGGQGKFPDENNAKNIERIRKKAANGDSKAMLNLGLLYDRGKGVPKSYSDALKWYRRAAEKGEARAMHSIGFMYQKGMGTTQSDTEALSWYQLSAEKGDPWAMTNLGYMYENGSGISVNYDEAIKWYKKASAQGDVFAMDNLGNMYFSGRGFQENYRKAAGWYQQAALQGFARSMGTLSHMYHKGKGFPKNNGLAYVWATLGMEAARTTAERKKFLALAIHMAQELNSTEFEKSNQTKEELAKKIHEHSNSK